jgi:hypothetical protein
MYSLGNDQDRAELGWQLRSVERTSVEEKLDRYIQQCDPSEMIQTLVLTRRSNVAIAGQRLGINNYEEMDEPGLIDTIRWKLGFPVTDYDDPHRSFWLADREITAAIRQAQVTLSPFDREQIRQPASSYFVALEGLLDDCLRYTSWALTTDHVTSDRPYVFSPPFEDSLVINILRTDSDNDIDGTDTDGPEMADRAVPRGPTLGTLITAFGRLSGHLQVLQANRTNYVRQAEQSPGWAGQFELFTFPFDHMVPFLDLMAENQEQLVKELRDIGGRLGGSGIAAVRNDWMHARAEPASFDRLRSAVEMVRDIVQRIEDLGLARQELIWTQTVEDAAGRSQTVLSDRGGREVVFHRPSQFAWLALPERGEPQCIMRIAKFAPGEALRFTIEQKSNYTEMRQRYPLRPARRTRRRQAKPLLSVVPDDGEENAEVSSPDQTQEPKRGVGPSPSPSSS